LSGKIGCQSAVTLTFGADFFKTGRFTLDGKSWAISIHAGNAQMTQSLIVHLSCLCAQTMIQPNKNNQYIEPTDSDMISGISAHARMPPLCVKIYLCSNT